jgi:RNA polymerase sigma factor (sigma-70 family)
LKVSGVHSLRPAHEMDPDTATSLQLWQRARRGDTSALNQLFSRLLPRLTRWTRGRLPRRARHSADTSDLVQDAMMNALRNLDGFEPRRREALQAYLRQAIRNRVRDEMRRLERRPRSAEMPVELLEAADDSPLERAILGENVERYRQGLARLTEEEQDLIVGRLELGFSYEQLALATGRGTPDAARMAIRRALLRLAHEIEAGH